MASPFSILNARNLVKTDSNARVNTLTFGDGTTQSTAGGGGGGGGGEVSGITFNNGTRKIELTQTSGSSPLDATIPQNEINTMTFNNGTRQLEITQSNAGTKTATIPVGAAGEVTGLSFNNATRVLEIAQTSGTTPSVVVPQNEVSSLAFNTGTNVLTINQSNAISKTITINPSGSGGSTNIIHSNISDALVRKVKELEVKLNNLGDEEQPVKKIKLQGKERLSKNNNRK